ncbi:MAG: hypothetical protein KAY46_00155 [Burkholderiaceae bacterium]|nr:hypothetical protein [Burkholderiaceae bacterium]
MIDLLRLVVLLLVPLFVSRLIARTGRAAPRAPYPNRDSGCSALQAAGPSR